MKKLIDFFKDSKKVYILIPIIMIFLAIIPTSASTRDLVSSFLILIIYVNAFRDSIKSCSNIWRMMVWLLIAPLIISIVLTAYVGIFWRPAQQDRYFIILLMITFILTWLIAACLFELNKIKAAVLIINAILTTILSVIFLTTLNADLSKVFFSPEIIQEATKEGFTANSLIELVTKAITLPYIISATWSLVIIELRSMKIIKIGRNLIKN